MQCERLVAAPRVLDDRGAGDVAHLLHHVELGQPIDAGVDIGQFEQLGVVRFLHVLHVLQPVVDQAMRGAVERGTNAAAAVVAADDHVLDLQHVNRELQHRQTVHVGMDDDVGHVAVDEELAGIEADYLVGGHAAVRTPDPEKVRCLLAGQPQEKRRVIADPGRGPGAVVGKQLGRRRIHRPPVYRRRATHVVIDRCPWTTVVLMGSSRSLPSRSVHWRMTAASTR